MSEIADKGLAIAVAALAVALVVAVFQKPQRPPTVSEIVYALNGGDNYAYLSADENDLRESAGEVRLWINATDVLSNASIFISPAGAARDYSNPRYWELARQKAALPVVYKGAVLLGRTLDRGDYIVEISARNGTFVEKFSIERGSQSIEVVRGDTAAVLYRR